MQSDQKQSLDEILAAVSPVHTEHTEEAHSTVQHAHEETGHLHTHTEEHAHTHDVCEHDHEHEHAHETCGCGHHHEHEHDHSHDSCGCGHEHHHEHSHDSCECGHDHDHTHDTCGCDHDHEHNHSACGCGHDHEHAHEHGHEHAHAAPARELSRSARGERRVFQMHNLSCAHCAAQMEEKIRALPGVSDAVMVFATRQLRIAADDPDARLEQIRRVCASIEPDVRVEPMDDHAPRTQEEEHPHELREILIGAGLMVAGMICFHFLPLPGLVVLMLAYVLLGGEVLLTALKNLKSGHVFDENFLMSLATLGAIAMGTYEEAVGVMLFYRVGEYFEHRAVEKSRRQIMEAVDLRPEVVHRIDSDGVVHTIPAGEAAAGDLLLVRPGDRIPLDGIVRAGESRIDTAPVTGEPVPVAARPGTKVISGCVNTTGALQIEVEHVLADSMVTRILNAVENAAASKPKMDRFISRFSRIYTPIVVAIAVLTAVIPSIVTGNWGEWIYTALTFLVISCPCALVLSVPLSFFAGIGAGSKRGILFKGGASLEALKDIKTVVMDKTGTLTQGNFVLQKIMPVSGMDENTLLSMAATCEMQSTHPIAQSIVSAAQERGLSIPAAEQITETAGGGVQARLSGVEILCGSRKFLASHDISLPASADASGGAEVFLAAGGRYAGQLLIADTIKPTAKKAMQALHDMNLTTVMLTGDAQDEAEQVAHTLGIQQVRARLLPDQKLSALREIRAKHGAVLYVGDGINDAPVLAGADVGAAMGSGADAAIEAADVVFMTSDPLAIAQAAEIAQTTGRIAWQNVIFALAVKILVMVLGLARISSMWLAVFADSGVAMLCVLNAIRILYRKD